MLEDGGIRVHHTLFGSKIIRKRYDLGIRGGGVAAGRLLFLLLPPTSCYVSVACNAP